jgi:hypothetical protein
LRDENYGVKVCQQSGAIALYVLRCVEDEIVLFLPPIFAFYHVITHIIEKLGLLLENFLPPENVLKCNFRYRNWVFDAGCIAQYYQNTPERLQLGEDGL